MRFRTLILTALVFVAGAAFAGAPDAHNLAQARNCFSCHATRSTLLGPAFVDISAKYAGSPAAEAKLMVKVLKGGEGVWGSTPMPANMQLSEAEARVLVRWILSL